MKIKKLRISNYKSLNDLVLENLENALILVGKNSTGKTAVLEVIRAIAGEYKIERDDFRDITIPVTVDVVLALSDDDLQLFHQQGLVSKYRRFSAWLSDFERRLPLFQTENSRLPLQQNRTVLCLILPASKNRTRISVRSSRVSTAWIPSAASVRFSRIFYLSWKMI